VETPTTVLGRFASWRWRKLGYPLEFAHHAGVRFERGEAADPAVVRRARADLVDLLGHE